MTWRSLGGTYHVRLVRSWCVPEVDEDRFYGLTEEHARFYESHRYIEMLESSIRRTGRGNMRGQVQDASNLVLTLTLTLSVCVL